MVPSHQSSVPSPRLCLDASSFPWHHHIDVVLADSSVKIGSILVRDNGSLELNSATLLTQGGAVADCSIKTEISGHAQSLVRSSSTTDESVVTVEMLGDFLKRSVASLDVEEVDDDEFETEPDAVEDVILPSDC